ncbi:MAG: FxsA family protein [Thiotrichales bacterium]|jgi:UPF0716 protein FxsA|nr:FxsA family protein [Thiotrichales bacterium]
MIKLSFGWLFIAFIADLFSLFLLADAIGAWWTLLWVLAGMLLGVIVILDAGDTLKSLGGIFATPTERVEAIKETPWLLLVGVLFFLPGVLSDIFALILWLPTLRKRVLRSNKAEARAPYSGEVYEHESAPTSCYEQQGVTHVVIEGEFIEKKPNK